MLREFYKKVNLYAWRESHQHPGRERIGPQSLDVTLRNVLTPGATQRLLASAFEKFEQIDAAFDATLTSGTSYSYLEKDLESKGNDTVWTTPIAYSDNSHDNDTAVLIRVPEEKMSEQKNMMDQKFVQQNQQMHLMLLSWSK